jgi:glycerophosphoryl diester phosphodiesterase
VRVKDQLACELRLIQLVGAEPMYAELLTPAGLRRVTEYAVGLGPHHSQLAAGAAGRPPQLMSLTRLAQDAGLQLHPYTFCRDDLPTYARTLEEWLEFFLVEARVDGLFCDHPDVAVRVRASTLKVQ